MMFQKLLTSLILAAVFAPITACNTIEGLGKDVERAGEVTQNKAADVKRKM